MVIKFILSSIRFIMDATPNSGPRPHKSSPNVIERGFTGVVFNDNIPRPSINIDPIRTNVVSHPEPFANTIPEKLCFHGNAKEKNANNPIPKTKKREYCFIFLLRIRI